MDISINPTPAGLSLECRLINASVAAYYISGGKIDPSAPGYSNIGLKQGTTPIVFSGGPETIDAGYVAETEDNWVFLVFRGTLPPFKGDFWQWIEDWMNDFRIGPTTWNVNGQAFGRVETGFAKAVLTLWPQVQQALGKINLSTKNGIIVTGHSKGASASFLAASLLKGQYFPNLLVEVCCYAPALVADRTFLANYNNLGLLPFSVRYVNEYDAVPFLPYVPFWDVLAAAERVASASGENTSITPELRQLAIENDYVPLGNIRYITTSCGIEYGQQAENDAWAALKHALFFLEFGKIADAHSAQGRYLNCVCS